MALAGYAGVAPATDDIEIRTIGVADLRLALAQGWRNFTERRGDLLFVVVIYPVVALLAALVTSNVSILPLVVPVAAGAMLLGPPLASGFYELARRRQLGLDSGWSHFLDGYRGPTAETMMALTSVVAVLFLAWLMVAWLIFAATMGSVPVTDPIAFVRAVMSTPAGWQMIIVGNLVGLGFAVVTLAMTVISFPMLIDRPVGLAVAIRTSVRVTVKNPATVAVWGLTVVALLVLGAITAFVGLGVALPVLGYASWHLYDLAVVRPHDLTGGLR
ncbi:DUF2189 domain-containing protein [Novosphingobium sp.]|uniref:DUF2189 domain-containing protein n=1 Tax=Novosphingobium sp. TaxID=1874826 RepID=UPI003342453F